MTNRYQAMFARLAERREGAFVPFLVLGDPTLEMSARLLGALVEGGADALELGIPFSDPIADGPTIQGAVVRALQHGMKPRQSWDLVRQVRQQAPDLPIGLLVYANLVFNRGLETFYREAADCGVDSVLVADVPVLEAEPFVAACTAAGLESVLMAPPNASDSVLGQVARLGRGYTYVLSRAGVTGADAQVHLQGGTVLQRLQTLGAPPGLVGFGISRPDHVRQALAAGAAGAISGSAVVDCVTRHIDNPDAMLTAVRAFVSEMEGGDPLTDVALVTCNRFPSLDTDSSMLLLALQYRGVDAATVIWSDTSVDWSRFRLAVVRSTWDYETQRPAYVDWAFRAAEKTILWNPPEVLRWNTDKRYLLELAARGVPVVPTVCITGQSTVPLDLLAARWGCERMVLKPAVSAEARNTRVVVAADAPVAVDPKRAWLVQPFLSSVETRGELSVICFNGEVAYAVSKVPKPGDFRVQSEHGGHLREVEPDARDVEVALRVLQESGRRLLYARIDLMYGDDGQPMLSEAEVTEPCLYHLIVPRSAGELAGHIQEALRRVAA